MFDVRARVSNIYAIEVEVDNATLEKIQKQLVWFRAQVNDHGYMEADETIDLLSEILDKTINYASTHTITGEKI